VTGCSTGRSSGCTALSLFALASAALLAGAHQRGRSSSDPGFFSSFLSVVPAPVLFVLLLIFIPFLSCFHRFGDLFSGFIERVLQPSMRLDKLRQCLSQVLIDFFRCASQR
jgi:hypothetical protein